MKIIAIVITIALLTQIGSALQLSVESNTGAISNTMVVHEGSIVSLTSVGQHSISNIVAMNSKGKSQLVVGASGGAMVRTELSANMLLSAMISTRINDVKITQSETSFLFGNAITDVRAQDRFGNTHQHYEDIVMRSMLKLEALK